MSPGRRELPSPAPTAAEEDYLKTLFSLTEWEPGGVSSSDLAAELHVANSSVTVMIRKLASRGWVSHEPYAPIYLTEAGRAVALSVVRRHRLIETFLVEHLGYSWDEVHQEADALEHAASPRFIERLDALLGFPRADPHGDRIPRPDGSLPESAAVRLSELDPGHAGVVERVSDAFLPTLQALDAAGVGLGDRLELASAPHSSEEGADAALTSSGVLLPAVAGQVWVSPLEHEGCRLPSPEPGSGKTEPSTPAPRNR